MLRVVHRRKRCKMFRGRWTLKLCAVPGFFQNIPAHLSKPVTLKLRKKAPKLEETTNFDSLVLASECDESDVNTVNSDVNEASCVFFNLELCPDVAAWLSALQGTRKFQSCNAELIQEVAFLKVVENRGIVKNRQGNGGNKRFLHCSQF